MGLREHILGAEKDGAQVIFTIKLEFYHGIQEIADFLDTHYKVAQKKLSRGEVPAKKDASGRWVLCNLDYYLSLRDA